MENGEKKPVIFSANENFDVENVPEELRELVKARMEAARTGQPVPDADKIKLKRDLEVQFQGGSGLGMLFKILLKASQQAGTKVPPLPRQRLFAATPAENEEKTRQAVPPGAVKPSSSGWLIWLIAAILAAAYYISSHALLK